MRISAIIALVLLLAGCNGDRFKSGTNTGQAQPTKLVALPHPRRAEAGDKTVIAGTVNPTVPRRVISSTSIWEWLGSSPRSDDQDS